MTTLVHTYKPRGSAKELFALRDREVLVYGPAGTGKSRACLEKLNAVAWKYPGMRGLIVRKTAVSITRSVTPEWKQRVLGDTFGSFVTYYSGSSAEPSQYRYSNGSSVQTIGMDNATRIMSAQFDVIYVQEGTELLLHDWELLLTRLRNGMMPYQQLIADCNPDSDEHWLWKRTADGKVVARKSQHEENPRLFDEDGNVTREGRAYMEALDNLTGVRYWRLRKGEWVGAEGLIYDGYDSGVHLIDSFEIPDSWTRYWSVDFGYTNPFVLQCWAEDPDGRLYLYRELYETQKLVEDHAKDILELVAPDGVWREPKPAAIVCDHDAEDRATLQKHLGMGTVAAKKAVSSGIQTVQSRMRKAGDGRPRIFLFNDALVRRDKRLVDASLPTSTSAEIPGYIWDEGKERPKKDNDHGCDAMRYICEHRERHSTPGSFYIPGVN